MLEVRNVSFGYGRTKNIISDLSFYARPGETIALSGASGSGKTTVLRLIAGLETPRSGEIFLPNNASFSAVFQEDRLIPWKSALENAALFSDENIAKELLYLLGLGDSINELPSSLSGGMKRRVAIARALAHPSDILLLDEAFTGLDNTSFENAIKVVKEYSKDKITIIATHDKREVEAFFARIVTV